MSETVLRSPAKINLSLRVFRPRPDGYHPIVSVFHEIDLCDTLTVVSQPGEGRLTLSCDLPGVPLDSRNLVAKAVSVFTPWNVLDLTIHIEKKIPVGGGLGGGSSNAGVILAWLNQRLGSPLSDAQLRGFALKLGADVVFFLRGGTALVSGIGEEIQAISPPENQAYVLVIPPISILSGDVYRIFDEQFPDAAMAPLGAPERPPIGVNDLREPVWSRYPEMADVEARLLGAGLGPVYLSGSGSTLFLIYPDMAQAQAAAQKVSLYLPDCRVELAR